MRTFLLLLALAPLAPAQDIDKLIDRHNKGDTKAATEIVLLGEAGVKALLLRLTKPRFIAKPPGVQFPREPIAPNTTDMVQLQFRFLQTKAPRNPATPRLLTEGEFAAMKALEGSKVVSAPRIVSIDAQLACITMLKRIDYTKAYDAQKQPLWGVVTTGIVLEARARIRANKQSIDLEIRCNHAALADDRIPTLKTPSGPIGVPQVRKREAAIALNMKPGSTTYLVLPHMGDEGPLVLVIQPKIIPKPKPAAPK